MQRLAVTCAALLALLAVASSSSASAEKLTLSAGGTALEPGNTLFLEGRSNLLIQAPGVECEPGFGGTEVFASVLTNSRERDRLQTEGFHVSGGGLPGPCRSFTGNAIVELKSLGETIFLRATGKATVGPVVASIVFEHEEYKGIRYEFISCVYKSLALPGTNTATATAQALNVEFEGNLGLRAISSSAKARRLCPAEAEMSLSLPSIENEHGVIEEQVAP